MVDEPKNPGLPGPGSNLFPTGDASSAPATHDPFGIPINQPELGNSPANAVTRAEFETLELRLRLAEKQIQLLFLK